MAVDLKALADLLGEAYEEINQLHWESVESESLKRLAIKVGVDHTRESDWVLEEIGRRFDELKDMVNDAAGQLRADNEIVIDGMIYEVDVSQPTLMRYTGRRAL
jgi:hypothetical protein